MRTSLVVLAVVGVLIALAFAGMGLALLGTSPHGFSGQGLGGGLILLGIFVALVAWIVFSASRSADNSSRPSEAENQDNAA